MSTLNSIIALLNALRLTVDNPNKLVVDHILELIDVVKGLKTHQWKVYLYTFDINKAHVIKTLWDYLIDTSSPIMRLDLAKELNMVIDKELHVYKFNSLRRITKEEAFDLQTKLSNQIQIRLEK